MGDRVLEKEEVNVYRFKVLREALKLPRVGERVRHKKSGRVWKVIEERELWVQQPGEAGAAVELVPALALRFWKVMDDSRGQGNTLRHRYTPGDHSFERYWEILEA
jgi:hypothetical protein